MTLDGTRRLPYGTWYASCRTDLEWELDLPANDACEREYNQAPLAGKFALHSRGFALFAGNLSIGVGKAANGRIKRSRLGG